MHDGQARNVEPWSAGCSTCAPGGSSNRPHAAPEIKPFACCLLQITQWRYSLDIC
jgi:hypothetical protein